MTALLQTGELRLDRRWFALFLGLLAALLLAVLLVPNRLLLIACGGLAGGVFLAFLLVYPWIIVPALVATTVLDITGQLLKETALGIPLTGFHLALGLTFLALLGNTCLRRRTLFPEFELKGPLFLLLGVMALSLTYSPNQPEATIGFMRTLVLVLFLYSAQVLIESRGAVHTVVISMALSLIGGSILAVVQIATEQFFLPASFVIAVGANAPRATGTFHNPNTFGTFLMCGVVFLSALMLNYRMSFWRTTLLLVSLAFGLAGLIATFSRSNWLAALVGLMVPLYLARKLRYLFITLALGGLLILAIKEFVPFAEHIFLRFLSIFTFVEEFGQAGRESGSARIYFLIAGLEMFLDHPLLGVGWRAFPVLFEQYKPMDFPNWVPTRESHTLFANMLAELGLVGFLASAWIVWRTLSRGFAGLKEMRDLYLRAVLIGLLSMFIAFQVSLSFTADFSNNFLWFFTGMVFAVLRLGEPRRA
ncbi:MAG: O-antigen ligase family protein [Candidatus Latescibacteria bacterium]|nr:O-antigen ligase family protein [Candidatus Latescibacterota bacterium]